mmetsp:Transcript_42074/g.71164  ORF Transcript_42074/g.71164 Transcript_42074/m.71164 type:complete len:260 (+) Transcript_42074:1652-2431(+)
MPALMRNHPAACCNGPSDDPIQSPGPGIGPRVGDEGAGVDTKTGQRCGHERIHHGLECVLLHQVFGDGSHHLRLGRVLLASNQCLAIQTRKTRDFVSAHKLYIRWQGCLLFVLPLEVCIVALAERAPGIQSEKGGEESEQRSKDRDLRQESGILSGHCGLGHNDMRPFAPLGSEGSGAMRTDDACVAAGPSTGHGRTHNRRAGALAKSVDWLPLGGGWCLAQSRTPQTLGSSLGGGVHRQKGCEHQGNEQCRGQHGRDG